MTQVVSEDDTRTVNTSITFNSSSFISTHFPVQEEKKERIKIISSSGFWCETMLE